MDTRNYTYRIIWSEEDQEYIGLCAEFPSLSWLDQNPTKALDGILSVVKDVVSDMLKNNEPIPEPLSLRKYSGKISARITPMVHQKLAIEAAEKGISINRLISAKLAM